ncbi:MAG TPA: aminotransferase class V-fold PLP-dependent enzyme, partial [Rhizomicrobium sp.]|nr:aminotransferase class V-fold PLP-dependent enzyme [Rhizomicrobium sp.]
MIYLDHNATSPLRPEARAAMERALATVGNPSSVHAAGRAGRALVEDAREAVAKLAHARTEDVIFTGGGTEADVLALYGAVYGAIDAEQRITRIFVSAVEHPAVLANAAAIAERVAGVRMAEIPVTAEGVVDVEALRVMLREGKGRTLVCVMAANNETGVIQPLDEIAKHVRDAAALLMVDAVQAAGKIALFFDADYVALSGHKIGAAQGTGALIVKEGAPLAPLVSGGGQERGKRG